MITFKARSHQANVKVNVTSLEINLINFKCDVYIKRNEKVINMLRIMRHRFGKDTTALPKMDHSPGFLSQQVASPRWVCPSWQPT